jgi:hypothetical protein
MKFGFIPHDGFMGELNRLPRFEINFQKKIKKGITKCSRAARTPPSRRSREFIAKRDIPIERNAFAF